MLSIGTPRYRQVPINRTPLFFSFWLCQKAKREPVAQNVQRHAGNTYVLPEQKGGVRLRYFRSSVWGVPPSLDKSAPLGTAMVYRQVPINRTPRRGTIMGLSQ